MDYRKTAKEIYELIGKKENIISAAHCATRLRLVIADNGKCDRAALENVDGVKGVFEASGQLQIILGTGTVNKVYDEFIKIADIKESSKEEVKQAAAAQQNIFKRAIKLLGDVFVPIIPAIVASGLLMGLLEGFSKLFPQMTESSTYVIVHLFSNASFVFLPILIAVSAAKVFGGNMFLGAVIGMIMIHPDLINAWSVSGMNPADIPMAKAFGLYNIQLVGYQGHVIPVVISVWLMSFIEKKLHKIVPEMIDLFVTPLVTVLVTGYLTLTVVGPVFSTIENYVLSGATALITLPLGIGSAIVGGLYAPTVVAGVHHMYNAIEAGLLSSTGVNTWMPIATAANVAQGAAALAVAVKTKNSKIKSVALPASLSAFLGITEPAIFGVNIRFIKSFIAGCIGGICGGMVAGITGVGASAYGITGIFGFLITTENTLGYALIMLVSAAVAFALSWLMYKDEVKVEAGKGNSTASVSAPAEKALAGEQVVASPVAGTCMPLSEVNDPTFAGEMLGKGAAVLPEEGVVRAPFDGTVETLFPTKHAIGLKNQSGMEVLIHIGMNTVELSGEGFEAFVSEGDRVKKGQKLVAFDRNKIKKAGYDLTTPVIVTNTDDYKEIQLTAKGKVNAMDALLSVK